MKRIEVGFKVKVLIISLGMVLLQLSVSLAEDVPNKFKDGESASAEKVNANFKDLSDRAFEKSGSHINYGAGNVGIGIIVPGAALQIGRTRSRENPVSGVCPSGTTWVDDVGNGDGVVSDGECQPNGLIVERGNVGIGLTNPVGKLQTQDTRFDEGAGNCPQGYIEGDFDGEGDFADCRAIGVTVLANGNVGIGTTTPQDKIHVNGTGVIGVKLQSTGGNNSYVDFVAGEGTVGIRLLYDSANNILDIQNKGTAENLMTITRGGKVGIGTTTPDVALHVNGGLRVTGALTGTTGWTQRGAANYTTLGSCVSGTMKVKDGAFPCFCVAGRRWQCLTAGF